MLFLASIKYKTYTETVELYQILCIHKVSLSHKKTRTASIVFDTTSDVFDVHIYADVSLN